MSFAHKNTSVKEQHSMPAKKIEGYLVSKHFDRMFMAFLLIGGISLFVIFPILAVMNG